MTNKVAVGSGEGLAPLPLKSERRWVQRRHLKTHGLSVNFGSVLYHFLAGILSECCVIRDFHLSEEE